MSQELFELISPQPSTPLCALNRAQHSSVTRKLGSYGMSRSVINCLYHRMSQSRRPPPRLEADSRISTLCGQCAGRSPKLPATCASCEVQGVAWCSTVCHTQTLRGLKHRENFAVAVAECAVNSPGDNDAVHRLARSADHQIVFGADRVSYAFDAFRVRGAERKQVGENQATKSPVTSKPDATPHCWIIDLGVSSGWVQPHKHDLWQVSVPSPRQRVTVLLAA